MLHDISKKTFTINDLNWSKFYFAVKPYTENFLYRELNFLCASTFILAYIWYWNSYQRPFCLTRTTIAFERNILWMNWYHFLTPPSSPQPLPPQSIFLNRIIYLIGDENAHTLHKVICDKTDWCVPPLTLASLPSLPLPPSLTPFFPTLLPLFLIPLSLSLFL